MRGCDPKRFCPDAPATRDVLQYALDTAGSTPEDEFTPTPDPAKAAPICPTARHCQKKSLTRTYVVAAISAFLRQTELPPPIADSDEPGDVLPNRWWLPPT